MLELIYAHIFGKVIRVAKWSAAVVVVSGIVGVLVWLNVRGDTCHEPIPELRETMMIDHPECAGRAGR